jgi:glycerophosphoryl diester phosphodiesterase
MLSIPEFFKTGHRGCRGLEPENTLDGFLEAIRWGANALEMDLVVSKDGLLVVSHEPYMKAELCLKPDGSELKKEEEHLYNLYQMPYSAIKAFDCGSKFHVDFPRQKKTKAYKPLLSEVIEKVEHFLASEKLAPVLYDLEIKSEPGAYNLSQPAPATFAQMVADFIDHHRLADRVIVRSFDPAPLQYLHQHHPELRLALIVENNQSAAENIARLGFTPFMYSPEYVLLTKEEMAYLKALPVYVVPWTVNTAEEMKEMLRLEVDGIITDYPDLFKTMGV